jgi:NTE family protein
MVEKGKKIGLAFSGGGYRAAAFHVGVFRTLNRLGLLNKVDVISSVSGGSIVAAYYALHQKDGYEAFEQSFIQGLQKSAVNAVYITGAIMLVLLAVLFFVAPFFLGGWANLILLLFAVAFFMAQFKLLPWSTFIERQYIKHFFGKTTLKDLPEQPLVAMNATDVETGTPFTFSRHKISCYKYTYAQQPTTFKSDLFPVSKAVMASSCVPHLFPPVKMDKKYQEGRIVPNILMVDGCLYDNQGAHKLTQPDSAYYTDYCIVSDAGNTYMTTKGACNSLRLIMKTVDILMNRIRSMQYALNMFSDLHPNSRFAYVALKWDEHREVERFVEDIKKGQVHEEVLAAHHISPEQLAALKSADKSESAKAFEEMVYQVKENIHWDELSAKIPSRETLDIAQAVGTNLTALTPEQINALIAHSEWLSEVQIRIYLPFLIG